MKRLQRILFFFCIAQIMTSCYYIEERNKIKKADNYSDNLTETVFFPEQFNQNGRIYYFVKVYGFLKVHSSKSKNDIDKLFFDYYPKIKDDIDKQKFNSLLNEFIFDACKNIPDIKDTYNPRYSWLNDTLYFYKKVKDKLLSIEAKFLKKGNKSAYYNYDLIGVNKNLIRPKIKYKPNDIDSLFPHENTRVWGIANYWNLVNYFWVYKNLMDTDWDKVLYESILSIVNAENAIEYNIAVMKFIAHTDDSHSYVYSDLIDNKIFGRYVPNIRLDIINDTVIVKKLRTERMGSYSDTIFKMGDIIYSINNTSVIKLYDSLKYFQSASKEERRKKQILPYVISSFQKSNQIIYSRNGQTYTAIVEFEDYKTYNDFQDENEKKKKNEITVRNIQDIGYIHIDELFVQNFDQNINELKKHNGFIIDMRGYPNRKISTRISNVFLESGTKYNDYLYPDIYNPGKIKRVSGKVSGGKNEFKDKKIAVLVDETTQSQAEFLTMILQQNENVAVIGSRTAGADGTVINIVLPGKINTGLASTGILYPDGTPTQRCGVMLNIEVKPTIKGLQAGRDEVLEKAVEWVKQK